MLSCKPYPVPATEKERLAALYAYDVLDSKPEEAFDRIAVMAARLFCAPIALVSLVDSERQWFKAKCGLDASETSRDFSFCTHAMLQPKPMVVCNATLDPRFLDNPLVTGDLSIRFYVGAPILSRDGLPLGTLCVIDKFVREKPAPHLLDSLMDLAYLVGEQLEYRSSVAARSKVEKQYQQELERSKQAADSANRAKSDFLARMSHEIRTPMNLIMGMNAILLESPLNEAQRKLVEISHRNVRRLLRLINGILDLSKVEAGELTFQAIPFDLAELLNECAATISSAVERNGLAIDVSIQPETWRYWTGDPERIQQVLLNLIGNAVKFTAQGSINVKVVQETNPQGDIGLRFEVSDTGCGIPKHKVDQIFEAFQQVDESMNRTYEGTGLGLTIARTLVERMSGKIWVEQKSAPGSTFVFTLFLPAAIPFQKVPECTFETPRGLENARILLVEDNPENVFLMQAYLANLSLSLDFASQGLEALDKCQHNHYDLVLMDVQMPIMDGYQATREIRMWEQSNRLPRVPIVALTANAFSGANAESIKAGCDAHLTKPIEKKDLLETIAKLLAS